MAVAAVGIMSDSKLLIQPNARMMAKTGTTAASGGTIMVAKSSRNKVLRPGNSYLAKAKPAIAEKSKSAAWMLTFASPAP